MTRDVYVLSDIHANLPALEAVLGSIDPSARILCAGDVVDYYADPNEVIALLQARGVDCIVGNHDLYALGELPYNAARESIYRVEWTRRALTNGNREWLSSLPVGIDYTVVKGSDGDSGEAIERVLLRHGDLFDPETYIYPDSDFDCSMLGEKTLAIFGHTHHPMVRRYGTSAILNPGSVGQPRDRNPAAAYAKVDLRTGQHMFVRACYDVASYQARLAGEGVVESMIDILSRTG
ncbi:metallophosphatase family protein [Cupriavidus sp. WGtm5]|uniref:metallophosphoesterase family protein n=1 Tax=Cupriavidus sp. WGtm5 TaxID=2919926 RepID=UPI00209167AD|nr:metallophosphoesterase family protein [Cupriavidus sp. WGtm5]MCO4888768.1 metallophosphatase family protein [Cupriavidus sp. WGtm5]